MESEYNINAIEETSKKIVEQLEEIAVEKNKDIKDIVFELEQWVDENAKIKKLYDQAVMYYLVGEFKKYMDREKPDQMKMGDVYVLADVGEINSKVKEMVMAEVESRE